MLRRTLLSSLLQTALLGAAGGIGFAPGKAAARNNARPAPVEESEADLVIVGSGPPAFQPVSPHWKRA